ncbi:MAG TPA: ADP-ribosyltransferase [Thermoanaerobaculia bacterium]|jgi:hypothetical protein
MTITFLNSVNVDNAWGTRTINLYSGDLSQMSPSNYVDYLVVSALPGDYTPTPSSLIGALAAQGVSVQTLSQNKAASYEPAMPCWISQPVQSSNPNIQFGRVVVFEPPNPVTNAAQAIPAIFQSINCFQGGSGNTTAALPLVSTGSGGAAPTQIMMWTFYSAATAAATAFPFNTINIVVYSDSLIGPMTTLFAQLASNYTNIQNLTLPGGYASFASTAWANASSMSRPTGMTVRQAFGINLYTSNYYQTINPPLYHGNINDPTYIALMPVYQCIDAGLAVLPGYSAMTYRGESGMSPQRIAQYTVGNVILHLAYTSTADTQGAWYQGSLYQFNINGQTGRLIAPYSQIPSENEVLYARNMTDQCTAASCNTGQTQCTFSTTQVNTDPCSSTVVALTTVAAKIM